MQKTRTITISLTSALDDDQFSMYFNEINEEVEQISCDYAAACVDDTYEVVIRKEE